MNSPEETLEMQRTLSVASGTKQIATWLMVVAVALAAVSLIVALRSKEGVVGSVASPLGLATVLALLRSNSEKRIREIMAALRQ